MNTTVRKSRDVSSMLISWESTFDQMSKLVGLAVSNLQQEVGGYPSTTPGNGSPGGGRGGGPTVGMRVEAGAPWRRSQVDPARLTDDERAEWERRQVNAERDLDRVPVSSVETQALGLAGRDEAAAALARLDVLTVRAATELRSLCDRVYVDPGPTLPAVRGPLRMVMLAYARVMRLRRVDDIEALDHIDDLFLVMRSIDPTIADLYHLVRRWGYTTSRPAPPRDRSELLAIDLTERWCTSHLRAGERRQRDRGELCDWCYRHGPLLVPTWTAPPLALVRLKIERGKVYAQDFEPYLRTERNKQRRGSKADR